MSLFRLQLFYTVGSKTLRSVFITTHISSNNLISALKHENLMIMLFDLKC